ncbi:NAD(P)H-dependent oxidoreductase [Lacrimispora sp. AGF001]|uniref:NAD(P)H-dependent oxidoreductase n=1 Tax=Lacrimispora sp. AGF001 TaxID=3401631 RepID=UPI003B431E9A
MNVLIINGSPKGAKSNSLKLTEAFLQGMKETSTIQTETLTVSKLDIKPCIGCFQCWKKTPGKCCISDDMTVVIEKILSADVLIYSFPLYYFGLPSQLKALLDRQLPMVLPFMKNGNHSGAHPSRYDMSDKRYVLISTCGFYTAEGNYDAIDAQFSHHLGKSSYESIYCGQGELFSVPELKNRTEEYLEYVRAAGREFAEGSITKETRNLLSQFLFPRDVFERMADASWGIDPPDQNRVQEKSHPAITFTRQMAALYRKDSWNGKDLVLEMHYTDEDKTAQLIMGKDGCKVLTQDFQPFTTRISTPLSVWMSIAKGEIDGQAALMKHLYQVDGDFQLMLHWDDYLGSSSKTEVQQVVPEKKSNMTLMLLPWFPLWFIGITQPVLGGILSILISTAIPIFFFRYQPTVFEVFSGFTTAFLGVLAISGFSPVALVPVSYLLFGLMWFVTVFLEIPLTAYYSMNEYGGKSALKNPLFIKTNRILTACWGILYLVTPLWTYLFLISDHIASLSVINTALPFLLGCFTKWFQKWYPAHYAASKKVKN